jgi:carboxyl-terminal processing protease
MQKRRTRLFAALAAAAISVLASSSAMALTDKGYRALHNFSKVLHYIEENYVTEVNEEELIQGAVRGMVETLDPHSVYMSPEINKELKVDTSGRFDGVGIEVAVRGGMLIVVSPIKGSPADEAGIETGDRIIRINGESTKGMNLGEAVTKMRGRRGSRVTLTLAREGVKTPVEVSVTRQIINVPSVHAEELGDGLLYVSISSFQTGTTRALEKALKDFSKKEPVRGLILDLRKNPGGLLDQAVSMSDLFIADGVIVTTESRGQEIDRRVAHTENTQPDYPIIVMVDAGSASAAEIVAAALQENARAKLLGTKSFGKGSVQTVIDLEDGSGLKLTIAYYKTPKGRIIQDAGVIPDIEVSAKSPEETSAEKTLPEDVEDDQEASEVKGKPAEKKKPGPKVDYQKQRAIEELKKTVIRDS